MVREFVITRNCELPCTVRDGSVDSVSSIPLSSLKNLSYFLWTEIFRRVSRDFTCNVCMGNVTDGVFF